MDYEEDRQTNQKISKQEKKSLITIKTEEQLNYIRRAGAILADCLSLLSSQVQPGVSGLQLDKMAEEFIRDHGAIPSCKGYAGFPNSICLSLNSEAVHCIPTNRLIKEGDVVKIDVTASVEGWNADTAITVLVPPVTPAVQNLAQVGILALKSGILQAKEGKYVGDITQAVFGALNGTNYGMVKEFVGHGIGRDIHERPQVLNIPTIDRGPLLVAGMTLCVEPIVVGSKDADLYYKPGEWHTFALSGFPVVHNEHTIIVSKNEPEVVTRRKDEII